MRAKKNWGIFKASYQPRKKERTKGRPDKYPQPVGLGDRVFFLFSQIQEVAKTHRDAQHFKNKVGADTEGTDTEGQGESHQKYLMRIIFQQYADLYFKNQN